MGESGVSTPDDPDHRVGPPPAEIPENQYWYRPPDSKARKYFEKIAVMRAAGHHDEEIAKRLKTTAASVRQYVYLAKKNGWATDEGEPVDLEAELALNIDRKVVRNINHVLDGGMQNWQAHEMTIAAAKGRGIFKNHEKNEGGPAQMPIVAIKVEMVGAVQPVVEANVGGVPAYVEGEVEDGDRLLPSASADSAVPLVPTEGVPNGANG
jgi:transposase